MYTTSTKFRKSPLIVAVTLKKECTRSFLNFIQRKNTNYNISNNNNCVQTCASIIHNRKLFGFNNSLKIITEVA